ncbi:hypothetical protein EVAR_7037_1 [Eumeta japonica]|uniref:YqaJ viral recombinase domain-containing protein n=1 Tax=Eumeta variegata TaxID=151549 RepID=A0A4C1YR41_EUMVA|nr:hypothetical protein EVAR_7037_1 [Eumeta japonica]
MSKLQCPHELHMGTTLLAMCSLSVTVNAALQFIGFREVLEEARKRKLEDCELIKYQPSYSQTVTQAVSMHQLVYEFKTKVLKILKKVQISPTLIKQVEEETREQSESDLWFQLRYGITASRAHEVSRCKTNDGTLVSLILGGKIPDTPSMKRGRILEDEVRKQWNVELKKINKCGLILNSKYPMIAGSPDGIFEDGIIEIKCPISKKHIKII